MSDLQHLSIASNQSPATSKEPDISLGQRRKKPRLKQVADPDSGVADMMDTESEEDSYESTSSMSEDEALPPRLPWDTKKRKRSSTDQDQPTSNLGFVDQPTRDEPKDESQWEKFW